jgi:hypothetical protein
VALTSARSLADFFGDLRPTQLDNAEDQQGDLFVDYEAKS